MPRVRSFIGVALVVALLAGAAARRSTADPNGASRAGRGCSGIARRPSSAGAGSSSSRRSRLPIVSRCRRSRHRGADEGVDTDRGDGPGGGLVKLAFHGAAIDPEHAFVRVLNAVAAPLDPRVIAVLERDPSSPGSTRSGRRIPPRSDGSSVLTTEAFGPGSGRSPELGIPGADGSGVTIALLDTGVDPHHPYVNGSFVRGIDVVDPGTRRERRAEPDRAGAARTSRHRARGARRGVERPRWPPRRRSGRDRSSRSGWPDGSPTRTGGSRSTAAPTSSSPGSRPRSIRTRTATRTTRPGSRSWGSWSHSRRSRTGRLRGRRQERWRSTCSSWPRGATTARPDPATEALARPEGYPAALAVAASDARRVTPDRSRAPARRARRPPRGRAAARRGGRAGRDR